MGDRTTVTLCVLTVHASHAETLFDDEANDIWFTGEHSFYEFHEVNNGNLNFLQKLVDEGIAYDSTWNRGQEYDGGTNSCRFTSDGVLDCREIYLSDIPIDPVDLMPMIDKPKALRQYILTHREWITPLPWDNQDTYGRLYRVNQLILPKV